MSLFKNELYLLTTVAVILLTAQKLNAHPIIELYSAAMEIWELVQNIQDLTQENELAAVFKRFDIISDQISASQTQTKASTQHTIQTLERFIVKNSELQNKLNAIREIKVNIDASTQTMNSLKHGWSALINGGETESYKSFAKKNIDISNGVNQKLTELSIVYTSKSASITEIGGNGLIELIGNIIKNDIQQIYTHMRSAQQILFPFYTEYVLTELQGLNILSFSFMIRKTLEHQNPAKTIKLFREIITNRTKKTVDVFKNVIKQANQTVWTSDPDQHIKNVTYEQLTELFQGIILNEVDLKEKDECSKTCEAYNGKDIYNCQTNACRQKNCGGQVYNCQKIIDPSYCPGAEGSLRRYEFTEYNGTLHGQASICDITKADSIFRTEHPNCDYCFCLCDGMTHSTDKVFGLVESNSDIENNMVVAGIRFVKYNRIFYLQIQQGTLEREAAIKRDSLKWVPLTYTKQQSKMYFMTQRRPYIDLDNVKSMNPNHVVTGVKLRKLNNHLNLQIRLTEFNYETGLLKPESSFWQSHDGERRQLIELKAPGVPLTLEKSVPTSEHNQYIKVQNSDYDKDSAQTTVPFIDLQPVSTSPPIALSGLGLYHKAASGSGGFVAPKLITYNLTSHVKPLHF